MKKLTLLWLSIAFYTIAAGQVLCGFDQKMKELKEASPEDAGQIAATEQLVKRYIAEHPPGLQKRQNVSYTVPVVIHVMHTGGAVGSIYNPTDAVLQGFINYLNQVFAGTYAGMEAPVGGGGIVNMELTFALAQRTPSCGPTNGIDRVDASSIPNYTNLGVNSANTNGVTDLTLKDFARWNTADYYNIWVVNKIDGKDGTTGQFTAGYAYFAGSSASRDGTVMLATQAVAGRKTLPHEIGHAFNLYHPFESSNLDTECTVNNNCNSDGDRVCDTDPISNNVNSSGVFNFGCRTGNNTCTSTSYTKNTENNFMSYTNCSSLFTFGQKARVQAAMSLPSRTTLASSLGATPCGTVINFAVASDNQTEDNTGTVIDCRRYTEYTYQMNIGSAPSATATVTLSYSGTATNGSDYLVTTNGNFAAPTNTLSFASGSLAPQPFKVRVFDDAATESDETVVINFTVNSGGGNAVKGIATPTFTLNINDNDAAAISGGTFSLPVGTYNSNISSGTPFRGNYAGIRMQTLFTAAELNGVGITNAANFTSMTLRVVTKNSTVPYNGFTISMANTTATNVSTGFIPATFTTVFPATNYSTVTGNNLFTFSTPFAWDGTSNILVNFCFDNDAAGALADVTEGNTAPLGATVRATTYSNDVASDPCSASAAFISNFRVNATFGTSLSGTQISTVFNSSRNGYVGPNDDVYFYDIAGKVIARVKNLTAFDYGCTKVTIDRAGLTGVQFWNANAADRLLSKSIKVVPANNTATGSYQVTLYYTQAEVAGWQTATGRTWAGSAMQVAKVSNGFFIPDVTPAQPHTADVTLVTGTKTAFGSDYSIRGDFSNASLSGFGAGVPGASPCATNSWTGAVNNLWSNPGNWSCNRVPLTGDVIAISSGTPHLDINFTVAGSLTLSGTGSLTVDPGVTLNVTGISNVP